jgi:small subunit ribosomal protein S15
MFAEEDADEQAEKEKIESEMVEDDISGEDVENDDIEDDNLTDAELARAGKRRTVYKGLAPSRQYCKMVAIENAKRTWQTDWNKPGAAIPIKIAKLTEVIRALTIHCRENYKDFPTRRRLIMRVADRRRLLDTLSWTDVEGYLKIREALKIRHTYRPEALINRIRSLRYPYRNRMLHPGKKTLARLKKRDRLFTRRLSRQLAAGADQETIWRTRQKNKNQRWASMPHDHVRMFMAGRQATQFVDPLKTP